MKKIKVLVLFALMVLAGGSQVLASQSFVPNEKAILVNEIMNLVKGLADEKQKSSYNSYYVAYLSSNDRLNKLKVSALKSMLEDLKKELEQEKQKELRKGEKEQKQKPKTKASISTKKPEEKEQQKLNKINEEEKRKKSKSLKEKQKKQEVKKVKKHNNKIIAGCVTGVLVVGSATAYIFRNALLKTAKSFWGSISSWFNRSSDES